MNLIRTAFISALCLSGVGLAPAVPATHLATIRAPEPYAAPEKIVSYSDLDLRQRKGVALLYARLTKAAVEVCDRVNMRAPQNRASSEACKYQAVANAVTALDLPALNAYAASKTHGGSHSVRYASQDKR